MTHDDPTAPEERESVQRRTLRNMRTPIVCVAALAVLLTAISFSRWSAGHSQTTGELAGRRAGRTAESVPDSYPDASAGAVAPPITPTTSSAAPEATVLDIPPPPELNHEERLFWNDVAATYSDYRAELDVCSSYLPDPESFIDQWLQVSRPAPGERELESRVMRLFFETVC